MKTMGSQSIQLDLDQESLDQYTIPFEERILDRMILTGVSDLEAKTIYLFMRDTSLSVT